MKFNFFLNFTRFDFKFFLKISFKSIRFSHKDLVEMDVIFEREISRRLDFLEGLETFNFGGYQRRLCNM